MSRLVILVYVLRRTSLMEYILWNIRDLMDEIISSENSEFFWDNYVPGEDSDYWDRIPVDIQEDLLDLKESLGEDHSGEEEWMILENKKYIISRAKTIRNRIQEALRDL